MILVYVTTLYLLRTRTYVSNITRMILLCVATLYPLLLGSNTDMERVVKDSANLVNANQYLKDKQDNELPTVISKVNHYIEELKGALQSSLSSEK